MAGEARHIGHQTRRAIELRVGLAVRNRQTLTMCLRSVGRIALANSDVAGIMDHGVQDAHGYGAGGETDFSVG